ncbi:hypothetical protein ROJ8625_04109 [Roseivivax jejudonensis]|uniref:Uncharacterized protein n=1 Tax=Roseivivax jejudonensis TaxID=1529041 RepID=A0A1X7ABE3_9RHOB|nr:hypothetical protein [Roseivivax jejudonensis]SLN74832.1 hypothetical protein ROJ8625_04109 [Roseivivax jejudonensis]
MPCEHDLRDDTAKDNREQSANTDLVARLDDALQRAERGPKRIAGSVNGQTIEAAARATLCQITLYDLEAVYEARDVLSAPVAIKPLEWVDLLEHSDDEGCMFEADAFGVPAFYCIRLLGCGRYALDVYEGGWIGDEHSLRGAEQAAEEDYRRRILSALEGGQ